MAKQPRSLAGKVVAITGGGRGIGRATARALATAGAKVAIGDVDEEAAASAAEGLGGEALGLRLDVTDRPRFTAFLDEVEQRLGPLDVLVNNAGIMPTGRFEDEGDDVVIRQLEINLHAVIHGTKEAARRMRPRGSGHIVNIASVAGLAGLPGVATYSATKFGVVGLSQAVFQELRGTGVDVSVVMPAYVNTELTAGVPDARGVKSVEPEQVADAIVDAVRNQRYEVYVPRSVGGLTKLAGLLPLRAKLALAKALKTDRVVLEADEAARAAYLERAAASAPAAEQVVEETAGR
jgi:NAD(P)-dependent dehydrogenase (short-subunit alcohol dehydrogenase family)